MMKTRDGSRILHPDKRMKTSIAQRARGPKPTARFYTGFRRFGVLAAFIAMLAATFYSASSASLSGKLARHPTPPASTGAIKKDGGASTKDRIGGMERGYTSPLTAGWLAPPVPAQSPSFDESIATYASDCVTPKTSFVLGETVCVQVTNAPFGSEVQRHISWVDSDGYIRRLSDVTDNPQSDSLAIPATATTTFNDDFSILTVNNRGTWTVNTIATSDAGLIATAAFIVSDPAQPSADVSVGVNQVGTSAAPAGGNVAFTLEVSNKGPDAAPSVEVRSAVPANTTFVSIVRTEGPTFTCTDPGAGQTGTIVCTGSSLAAGEKATLTAIYQVASGTPDDTAITSSASVTSGITELRTADNTGTGEAKVGPAPCTLSCPADIDMNNDQDSFGAVVTFNAPTTTGVCGTVTSTPASGSFFPVGTTTVSSAGTSGSPCSFTVTIHDTQAPVIACPADITTQESSSGSGSAVVNYAPPSVTENDPAGAAVTCDHPSGSSFSVGTTAVTCTATDAAGNTSQPCSFNVTVEGDASNCALGCPADITVDAEDGQCGAHVTYPDATASTECGTVSYSKPSGDLFPVGTTTVTVTSTAGRSCSFKVKVEDKQAPTVTPPPNKEVNASATACEAAVDPGTATATDNCSSSVTVTGARDDGEPLNAAYPVGTTTITWTATDGAGNTSAGANQTITVKDVTPPTVSVHVPPELLTVDADANCHAEIPDISPYVTASDNCGAGVLTITQSPVAGTIVGAGTHPITVTVIDGDPDGPHNTTTSPPVTFTVRDVTPPVISCPANVVAVLPLNNTATSMAVSYPAVTATDSCAASVNVTSSPASGSVFPMGTTVVNATATDASGNTSSCSFTVTVLYNFTGFFQPVDNLPVLNTVNAGRAIPVKFSLSGNKGLAVFASGYPASGVVPCNSTDPVNEIEETVTAGGSSLSYDASSDQYIYVWKTNSAWAGTCRQLVIQLNDGSTHYANFKFR
jgi:uncharacterized repeat protein (TIGR01451 family)